MKKILVASTALALLGGAAMAEVKVTGDGRMGIQYYKSNVVDAEGAWDFTSRIRITFTASGETDGGLAFGGSIRADNAANGAKGHAGNVWVSGSFGKLSLGDVDSAAEAANGQLWGVGLDDREWDHITYVGAGASGFQSGENGTQDGEGAATNPVALYQYSFGDGNVFVSLADGNDTESWGVAGNYKFGDFTVGAGYEKQEDVAQWSLSGAAVFGDFGVKAIYAKAKVDDFDVTGTQYGVGVNYTANALTVSAFYRNDELDIAGASETYEAYGIGASYDLGGGAKIVGGYVNGDDTPFDLGKPERGEHFSIGLSMTF